jgi:hypothetical protein
MDVTRSQSAPLDIADLVEHEHRVIAGAAEMPIVGAAFLLPQVGLLLDPYRGRSSLAVVAGAPCR